MGANLAKGIPPPPAPPMLLLEGLSAPALLSISLLATSVVMLLGAWALTPREKPKLRVTSSTASSASAPVPSSRPSGSTPAASKDKFHAYETKMRAEGCSATAIAAFRYNFSVLVSGANLMIGEADILRVDSLPTLAELDSAEDASLLKRTVMLKLNGGLGTGMGLATAKSLLVVKGSATFLDLIAEQLVAQRQRFGASLNFMLMNSFSTSKDSLAHLSKYAHLPPKAELEFVQNMAPKVTAADLSPASWPKEPSHEWCPPGHGDLYPALVGSGTLDRLLGKGVRFMFVSNSDNLGATLDLKLLTHFASSGAPFMMEVAERTDADKKGGHLARDAKTGGLVLRESAQCPEADEKAFQDVAKYKYFNTNNLYVDLLALKAAYVANKGALPLPVMKNSKTVDPRDKASTKVLQLETAMGSAISCFPGAIAVCIPRTRFAPVKTTSDLLVLRSDAYVLTPDVRMELALARRGVPPDVKLDDGYKFVDQLDKAFPHGAPSLLHCKKLVVNGPVVFSAGVVIRGTVTITNTTGKPLALPRGAYGDVSLTNGPPLYDPTTFKPPHLPSYCV